MSRPRPGTDVPDNRKLFEDEDDGFTAELEVDVAEMFGGSTDAATVERVTRQRVAGDWRMT